MILNLLVIVFVLGMAIMWSTYGLFSAFLHLLVVIVAGALAFAFWEPLVYNLLLGFMPSYAWGLGLVGLFAVLLIAPAAAAGLLRPGQHEIPPAGGPDPRRALRGRQRDPHHRDRRHRHGVPAPAPRDRRLSALRGPEHRQGHARRGRGSVDPRRHTHRKLLQPASPRARSPPGRAPRWRGGCPMSPGRPPSTAWRSSTTRIKSLVASPETVEVTRLLTFDGEALPGVGGEVNDFINGNRSLAGKDARLAVVETRWTRKEGTATFDGDTPAARPADPGPPPRAGRQRPGRAAGTDRLFQSLGQRQHGVLPDQQQPALRLVGHPRAR